jgi:hypothetical protein
MPPRVSTRAVVHKIIEREQVDLTDTLIKNIKIQEVVHVPLRFGDELKFHKVMRSDSQESKVSLYESAYFQNLVSKSKIPLVNYDSSPKGIFNLLKDAADQYVVQTKGKLGHDFYVICMLNALFGDPRIHLIQKHPSYLSRNNSHFFDKSMKLYAEKEYVDFKLSNECSKQRKNAVTELMRQICSIEYGPKAF